MNLEIANRLAQLRRERGYSQESLARELGVSRQAISKWERGEAAPEMENLILLSGLFQVSLDTLLLGGEGVVAQTQAAPEPPDPRAEENDIWAAMAEWDAAEQEHRRARRAKWRRRLLTFPYPVLVTGIFLLLGFYGGHWHPGWIIFLTIPIYYCVLADGEKDEKD